MWTPDVNFQHSASKEYVYSQHVSAGSWLYLPHIKQEQNYALMRKEWAAKSEAFQT